MIYLYLFGTCFHFIYVFMIIGNDNALNRPIAPKYQDSLESCIIPQITPKFERLVHLSATVHEQSPRNSLSRTRHPPLTFWCSEGA